MTNNKTKHLIDVPYINQSEKWPTGCESVTAVMLLHFLQFDIDVDTFIEQCLEKRAFEERAGELYGPDPAMYFAGSPYEEDSMGCYAPVIVRALEKAMQRCGQEDKKKDKNTGNRIPHRPHGDGQEEPGEESSRYEIIDETGKDISDLIDTYIDHGMPVPLWAAINMRDPIVGPKWRLFDSGEEFTWISNEHCMLLVGYDAEKYYFNDPYENNGVIGYEKKVVEDRYRWQHMQAVGVRRLQTGKNPSKSPKFNSITPALRNKNFSQ
ncbi:C39 family peptidase [Hespellia stercorisuis]|uniref:Uncharacterized protein YvpB n=1 Tax=Hespellia stercorisuis DSM 15480 TaxID=1121950 RepID=A0A1M6MCC1_9FIRM|nr:C39 family peptidase [Hespellia stercorisuis]SHJ81057.1 Uncharacterized protein YvpB [Hespellia stercorisuis DSM 15480]